MAMVTVMAFAAAVDLTTGSTAARMTGSPTPVILEKTIDFATAGVVTGDVVKVIYLPADTKVEEVFYRMVTANVGVGTNAPAASTVNIGDTTTAAKWASALDLNTASAGGAVNSASNVFYSAADSVKVTLTGGTPIAGKLLIKVHALLYGETAVR